MASIDKIDEKGALIGKHELAAGLVQDRVNSGLLHYVVKAEQAGHRQGTPLPECAHIRLRGRSDPGLV